MTDDATVTQADLKPCPFCGGKAEMQLDPGRNIVGVGCTKCTANQPPSWDISSERWAKEAWNTRLASSPPQVPGQTDALREAWQAGRDAAVTEIGDLARLSKHLVHPLFVPAIYGVADTLECPALTAAPPTATTDTPEVSAEREAAIWERAAQIAEDFAKQRGRFDGVRIATAIREAAHGN